MLLAADRVDDSGRIVRMLEPPHGSKPGDQVCVCLCVCVYMCVCVFVCIYTCVCMQVCEFLCVSAYK